ncbi:Uncharacterized protein Fot_38559 [Forsythia ovata]|uniref:Uncharacterized protein n=1 Tax=Forsythia ovata TaxID=205694 RepID=A0ABD1S273_9LAMI
MKLTASTPHGTFALKTLSKPIAIRLKKEAGRHPKFRNFITSFAQANHWTTTTMQRRIHSHATDVKIRPMNEEKAVQADMDLLGEFFIFSVYEEEDDATSALPVPKPVPNTQNVVDGSTSKECYHLGFRYFLDNALGLTSELKLLQPSFVS